MFLAFGFNLVDCGGLLGGRLDSGDAKLPSKKVRHGTLHSHPQSLPSHPDPSRSQDALQAVRDVAHIFHSMPWLFLLTLGNADYARLMLQPMAPKRTFSVP